MKVQVYIPSRMASTRLPGKPLAEIAGKAMICHVWDRAMEADVGDVFVACDDARIEAAVTSHGGKAIMTDSDLPSGSDRIWQAVQRQIELGGEKPDIIINVQGDEPCLPPEFLTEAVEAFKLGWPDVVTFAHEITNADEMADPGMVKLVASKDGKAHYFSRCPIPHGAVAMKRHIGFYAYKYEALEKFVSSKPSPLEEIEKLEQLRGLDLGLNYYVAMTTQAPIGVDTPADLEKVRRLIER
ncbi:MAG: 3-deoxy-manno-octulosonate cytidylyltransferase (CMP-KDO synthetase) [Alphaproteobacteria bacterium]|jgi:3-deoxy-manno-octulosonate cytidylyltransferase (CMP-KDO synthetase)